MAQKLAPAEKNSTGISAASATFCISAVWYWTGFSSNPKLKRLFCGDDTFWMEQSDHEIKLKIVNTYILIEILCLL